MELINNTTKTLKDDLSVEIKQGSKLSIAAACFSIYAFQELKEQLSQIEELRFIFTSPTFVTEKAKKERREFYIPRLTRERNLYGTEFEIKLRNELTQKAIARECAEWIRQKVTFKSNVSDKSIQGQIVVDGVGYTPINNFTTVELGCEKGNAQIFRHFVENCDKLFFHDGTLLFCVPSSCPGISPYLLILAEIMLHQAVKQKLRFIQGFLYGNF